MALYGVYSLYTEGAFYEYNILPGIDGYENNHVRHPVPAVPSLLVSAGCWSDQDTSQNKHQITTRS